MKQMVEEDKKAITAKDEDERQALHWGGRGSTRPAVPFYRTPPPPNLATTVALTFRIDLL